MTQNKSVEEVVEEISTAYLELIVLKDTKNPVTHHWVRGKVLHLLQQERQTSQERERKILETRICNRVGVHTCRANTIHIPFRFCGKIEDLLTNPNKD